MSEMVKRLLRQKLGNIGIVLVLIAVALLTVLSFISRSGGPPILAVLLVSAGVVSRDIASGTVQMILARPVRRFEYLLGRYLGILVLLAGLLLLSVLLCLAFQALFPGFRGSRGSVALGELLRIAAGQWMQGALLAATLLFFSTFLWGIGDVLAYLLLGIGLSAAGSMQRQFPEVARGARLVQENLMPDVSMVFRGVGLVSAEVGRYVLALAVFLIGALYIFSRREFSYGQD